MTALSDKTQAVYEANADAYDKARTRTLHEARWLARFGAAVPHKGSVLDLGCGAGEPIASWLIAEGFDLTGVDFSDAMLDIARARWPDGDWREGDMRALDLGKRFDAIIAWNSFFHLTQDEQRACLPRLAAHLNKGGTLMVTVGPDAGETTGDVAGDTVYHASLSPMEYVQILDANGLRLTAYIAEDPDCNRHSVLMARKD
ncbi:trans-aconitate methyltransferase [Litoreibacter halocynthiae]|uniref:Trans-aconitate methyltransferase n=1 Tax=Litoreibacter halocynthiae TaxID=1242689 RepID=A0A4R7LJI3_9RHOB|nr:class I SAM-dependent methyltransferase [Litoreibacter halocynthiae]TDT74782.1 trans-aconitate methyltransferase [Litoreibacter halocynthiae]